MTTDKTKKIAELNDLCRERIGVHGILVKTSGIAALPRQDQWNIWQRVATFSDFSGDNNLHGERNCGAFEVGAEKVVWTIDYYNLSLTDASPDPSDPAITKRMLTVMLAQEY